LNDMLNNVDQGERIGIDGDAYEVSYLSRQVARVVFTK